MGIKKVNYLTVVLIFIAYTFGFFLGSKGMVPKSAILASAGRPMSYVDLSNGMYTVVSVINKDSGIAVVEREHGSLYFVTRIPVGMMEEQYKFVASGTPKGK